MTDACTVYFLDPIGNRTETWPIGEDGIPADTYARLPAMDEVTQG